MKNLASFEISFRKAYVEGSQMKRVLSFLVVAACLMTSAEAALLARYSFTSSQEGTQFDNDAPVLDGQKTNMGLQDTTVGPAVGSGNTPGGYLFSGSQYNASTSNTGLNAQQFTTANFSGIIGAAAGSRTTITGLDFDAMVFNQAGTNRVAQASDRGAYIVSYRTGTLDQDGNFAPNSLFTILSPFTTNPPGSNVNNNGEISAAGEGSSTAAAANAIRMVDSSGNAWPVGVYKTYTPTFRFPVTLVNGEFAEFRISLIRQGNNITAANNRPFFRINQLQFYGEAVPEPTSMAIFGAMGLGLVARRFRKK